MGQSIRNTTAALASLMFVACGGPEGEDEFDYVDSEDHLDSRINPGSNDWVPPNWCEGNSDCIEEMAAGCTSAPSMSNATSCSSARDLAAYSCYTYTANSQGAYFKFTTPGATYNYQFVTYGTTSDTLCLASAPCNLNTIEGGLADASSTEKDCVAFPSNWTAAPNTTYYIKVTGSGKYTPNLIRLVYRTTDTTTGNWIPTTGGVLSRW